MGHFPAVLRSETHFRIFAIIPRNAFIQADMPGVFAPVCINSASNGCMGTGALEALLFGKPTAPQVHVRRT